MSTNEYTTEGIAIIGMSGRFPGSENIEKFWENLRLGRDGSRFFTDDELAPNVPKDTLRAQNFLRSGYPLDGFDLFDAEFFGITPRQAKMMDPQQRLFLECAWEALDNAGYGNPENRGLVGVFAGAAMSTYLLRLADRLTPWDPDSFFEVLLGNDKDYLASKVCYKLNLRGPAAVTQSACSSSLLAVAMGSQALLDYQADMILAGGVNVEVPQAHGCLCREGDGFISPEGRCRAFDADASGIVQGNGLGIVVLKRLADAVKDRDTIYAVIRGFAVNNDGADKVGFTAPSVAGQREVIAEALSMAGIPADSISYVEAHGTGTALGDPIEMAALSEAYQTPWTGEKRCAIGSVKTNIGHLNTAAGVASLIKTALALRHRVLPPSLHYRKPNPAISFDSGPFYVNQRLSAWDGPLPLRAGVSSFGFGGTNVHLILEEAPPLPEVQVEESLQIIPLSARNPQALRQAARDLAEYLERNPDISLFDTAYTLQNGRTAFPYRMALVCRDKKDALDKLRETAAKADGSSRTGGRSLVFWFPAAGNLHRMSGRELAATEYTDWHDVYADCRKAARQGKDKAVFDTGPGSLLLSRITEQICAARFWMGRGITPWAVSAQGIGTYAAAVISGALELEEAFTIAASHADWMHRHHSETDTASGIIPSNCTAMLRDAFAERIRPLSLPVLSAPDSPLPPAPQTASPTFWAGLLRGESQAAPLPTGETQDRILLSFDAVRRDTTKVLPIINMLVSDEQSETPLRIMAELWRAGTALDWDRALQRRVGGRHVPLPGYPFERQRFFIEQKATGQNDDSQLQGDSAPSAMSNRLYTPAWVRLPEGRQADSTGSWLVFAGRDGLTRAVLEELRAQNAAVTIVRQDIQFGRDDDGAFRINQELPDDYQTLVDSLMMEGLTPDRVLYLWSLPGKDPLPEGITGQSTPVALSGLANLASSLARLAEQKKHIMKITIAVDGIFSVTGNEHPRPENSLLLGPARVMPTEFPNLDCLVVDLAPDCISNHETAQALIREAAGKRNEFLPGRCVALRNGRCWRQCFAPLHLEEPDVSDLPLRQDGVYLITGGLGGIGLALAGHLASEYKAKLVLLSRTPMPARKEWETITTSQARDNPLRNRIEALMALEAMGSDILILCADVGNESDMADAFAKAHEHFGAIHGIIHAAGVRGGALMGNLPLDTRQSNFSPKVTGTVIIDKLSRKYRPDFVLLCSSLAVYGGVRGSADYVAANAFMDSWAECATDTGIRYISVNWNTWTGTGMAETSGPAGAGDSMAAEEGIQAFRRILASGSKHVTVCTRNVENLLRESWYGVHPHGTAQEKKGEQASASPERHPRPDIDVPYESPRNAVEQTVAGIWQDLLDIDGIGIHDPFLEIGGDSLMALTLDTRMREIFPVKLPLNLVLNHGTVAALAEYLMADAEYGEEVVQIAELYQQVAGLSGPELEARLSATLMEERP